jgi:ABC-type siderophore export system fused ATPase/permease subunit
MVNVYELGKEQEMVTIMFLIYIISVVISGFYVSIRHKELVVHINETNIKKNRRKLTPIEEYTDIYLFVFLPVINSFLMFTIIAEVIFKLIRRLNRRKD